MAFDAIMDRAKRIRDCLSASGFAARWSGLSVTAPERGYLEIEIGRAAAALIPNLRGFNPIGLSRGVGDDEGRLLIEFAAPIAPFEALKLMDSGTLRIRLRGGVARNLFVQFEGVRAVEPVTLRRDADGRAALITPALNFWKVEDDDGIDD